MTQTKKNLIDVLYHVHRENSRQQYYARQLRGSPVSTMPLTSFVYEFFLFNSLYQVDWKKSFDSDELSFHPDEYNETKMQAEYVKFIKGYARENPSDLYRAFEPLMYLPKTEGEWTQVTPDARITAEEGARFFRKIYQLQSILADCRTPAEMPTTKKIFELIDNARHYIYLVRNNIFHGSKTLGAVHETNQKRRLEVYDLFLKGLTSMFFLAVDKPTVASDFVPCPISSQSLPVSNDGVILDQDTVWRALTGNLMKQGDSRLIARFTSQIVPPQMRPSERAALFYPSAGRDLLTPLLLGLPYCTQFYYFEKRYGTVPHGAPIDSILRYIPTVTIKRSNDNTPRRRHSTFWTRAEQYHSFEFEYEGIPRKIYWMHMDNLEFLEKDVDLAFYFHRGDSREGGSGQMWDSELLPELINKIPAGKPCIFVTDGVPGGVDEKYIDTGQVLNFPFIERNRKYYYGALVNTVTDNNHADENPDTNS